MSDRIKSRTSSSSEDCAQPMLINRRTCLAVAGGVLAISGVELGSLRRDEGESFAIPYVLTDRRIPESLEFGRALSARGSEPLEVTAGLTAIWRQVLVPLWEGSGGAVAGLTSRGVWDCVTEQARSHRRRSILVGFHSLDEQSGAASHWLNAPPQLVRSAEPLATSGQAWPQTMAVLATRCNKGERACAGEWRSRSALLDAPPSSPLVSWLIG